MDERNAQGTRPTPGYEPTMDSSTWESGDAPMPAGRMDYSRMPPPLAEADGDDEANSDPGNPGRSAE
ncbi:MAG TPA: hypothetical protein VM536_09080, partial [Chloroflexia bacterium]|nr:hypothetical protein [Chloroflexia bacterium]